MEDAPKKSRETSHSAREWMNEYLQVPIPIFIFLAVAELSKHTYKGPSDKSFFY
jgi:hypothetical protein